MIPEEKAVKRNRKWKGVMWVVRNSSRLAVTRLLVLVYGVRAVGRDASECFITSRECLSGLPPSWSFM